MMKCILDVVDGAMGRRDESRLYKVDGIGTMTFIINVCACRDADSSRLEEQTETNNRRFIASQKI